MLNIEKEEDPNCIEKVVLMMVIGRVRTQLALGSFASILYEIIYLS